jgi:hypothetical protein
MREALRAKSQRLAVEPRRTPSVTTRLPNRPVAAGPGWRAAANRARGYALRVPVDAVSEFRILTLNAPAEYGNTSGAMTSILQGRCFASIEASRTIGSIGANITPALPFTG